SVGMDVRSVASAATSQKIDSFFVRSFRKTLKRIARELDGFHLIRELRQLGEAGNCIRGAECRRLSGNRYTDSFAHLAGDRQHAIWFLLTVDVYNCGTSVYHSFCAIGRSVSIRTLRERRTERHGGKDWQLAVAAALNCYQHFFQVKEGFEDQKIHSGIGEQS